MKKFENIVLLLMIIPMLSFTLDVLAQRDPQIQTVKVTVLNFNGVKRYGPALKKYSSHQKYYNEKFVNNSNSKGTLEIRLIEEYSPEPDPGSDVYASAWYTLEQGETEDFYGRHFNYENGVYDVELRNAKFSLQTYNETGLWYVSYE